MVSFRIIIVHFKGVNDTINCINSLKKLNYRDFKIVVVDNSIAENEAFNLSLITSSYKNVTEYLEENICLNQRGFIKNSNDIGLEIPIVKIKTSNNGFSAANNIGIKYFQDSEIGKTWYWLLNNDTEVEGNVLTKINNFLGRNVENKIGIVGNDLFNLPNKLEIQSIGGTFSYFSLGGKNLVPKNYNEDECYLLFKNKGNYIAGASMFVGLDFIKDVGFMNENYFLYYEEIDWAIRAKKKGWYIGYCFGAIVYHKEGASIGSNAKSNLKSDLSDYHGLRSKMIFIRDNIPEKHFHLVITLLGSVLVRFKSLKLNRIISIFNIYREVFK